MAKPIIGYVLWRGGWGFRMNVLRVTSEKGRQVYGRDLDDCVTHIAARDVIYRFPEGTTQEFADGAKTRAEAERLRHDVGISQAEAELSRLKDVRDAAVLAAAKGDQKFPPRAWRQGDPSWPSAHTQQWPVDEEPPPPSNGINGCARGDHCTCSEMQREIGCIYWIPQNPFPVRAATFCSLGDKCRCAREAPILPDDCPNRHRSPA